jgi:tRNA(Ile)-lysidine synthase
MLKEKVRETIKKYGMLSPGDRVVVGVSGGPDSVALLHILKELTPQLKISLSIAHLNHGFRLNDSDRDAEYVQKLALELGLPVIVESRDVPAFIKEEGLSPENGARRARYDFFNKVVTRLKANKIALGHNADDQAETVLMRLLRGSGREGLSGIPPARELKPGSRVKIIRPLIEATREAIERYLKQNRIKTRLDASNIESVYLRNRIRLKLLPLLAKYNPNIKSVLIRTAQVLGEEDRYLERIVDKHLKRIVKKESGRVTLGIIKLSSLSLPIQRRILRESLRVVKGDRFDIQLSHIDDIIGLLKARGKASLDLPGNILVTKEYRRLSLGFKKEKKVPPFKHSLKVPGITKIPEIGLSFHAKVLSKKPRTLKEGSKKRAYFDYQRIKAPLFLRNREEGDRFQPLGMRGSKKLKDFFMDEKIPLKERERTSLLLSGKEIIWVVGHRISDKAKVTNKTKKVLMVEVKKSM